MSPLLTNEFDTILNGCGRNDYNRRALRVYKQILPPNEWAAVSAWISSFFGYQQDWLLDQDMVSVLVKARQTGGSFTYAAVALLWALAFKDRTVIVSMSEDLAAEVIAYVRKHMSVLEKLGSKRAISIQSSSDRITLTNGGSILSRSKANAGRGLSGNIILDEAAYYKAPGPAEVIDSAFAVTTHNNYKIRILSTPNGVGNKFYEIVKDHAELGYRLHQVTITEAIEQGLKVDIDDLRKKMMGDDRLFNQTYGCSFLDSEFQYIENYLIQGCSTDKIIQPFPEQPYYGGLDIGRSNDLTVLLTIQRLPDPVVKRIIGMPIQKRRWVLRGLEKRKRTSSDDLHAMVDFGFQKYNYRQLAVDATGLGIFPAEQMVKKHGFSRVNPIMFTSITKAAMATGMHSAFANNQIIIPNDVDGIEPDQIRLLRQDVASIQRIVSENGNISYNAPHTTQGHADRAWALALALLAALKAPTYARLQQ